MYSNDELNLAIGNNVYQNKAKLKCDPYVSTQLIIEAENYHISLTRTKKLKQIESLFFIISSEPKLFAQRFDPLYKLVETKDEIQSG